MPALSFMSTLNDVILKLQQSPPLTLLTYAFVACIYAGIFLYLLLYAVAPIPRPPRPSEKTFKTILPDGETSNARQLPCWVNAWKARKQASNADAEIEEPEVFMSVVVPAYNEEARMTGMLEEAVEFLQAQYGDAPSPSAPPPSANGPAAAAAAPRRGWELLIVSDGSTDSTVATALAFARSHQASQRGARAPGPWSPTTATAPTPIPLGAVRVVALERNRGKGGAVTHGLRHVRGAYAVFADADGASRFGDLAALVEACEGARDGRGRAVAIGSRAHLVGSEAVVKRSLLRNTLMRGFHLFIRLLTPPVTSRIKDTQCGFKLFSRAALPDIVPYMHMEGWIFDVEMLMLAESAKIPMVEVPVGWKEVSGSKLNVIKDSIAMAWGLAVLRASWFLGIYRRT